MSRKKSRPPVPPPARVSKAPAAPASPRSVLQTSLLITAAYFLVALIGVLHHEMWRDEFQAWLVARDSHSFSELLANNKYEGHPLLWYTVLYALTSVSVNPFFLQALNLACGTAAVFLFCRFSNFTLLQKILFAFGYYVLYEYTLIARYHTLALLLVMLFCALYKNRKKNMYWMFLLLFLLANASLINNVLAIALTGIMALDFLLNHKKEEWAGASRAGFAAGVVFVLAGMVVSALMVLPEEDNMFNPSMSGLWDPAWIPSLLSRFDNAYLTFRELTSLPHWTAIGSLDIRNENVGLHLLLSFILFACTSLSLLRKPLALLFYWTGTFGLLLIYGITYLTAVRYMGHLFIAWFVSLWLYEYFRPHKYSGITETLADKGRLVRNALILAILACQVPIAGAYYLKDLERPFSASQEASAYLREQKLDTLPILGTIDFSVSPFSGWLNKPIFYAETRKPGSFVVWDSKRKVPNNFGEVIPMIDSLMKNQNKLLVITSYKISFTQGGESVDLEHDYITETLKIDLLKRFEKTMVKDEAYSIYIVERTK